MAIYSEYEKQIWDALNADIQNDYGVAGMMGNLYAESSLFPGRVEGDFTSGYTISVNYTNAFRNGQITREQFRYNTSPPQTSGYGPGYGLAQWTFYSRKYNYYDYAMAGQHGQPGSVAFEVWFLLWELQNDFASTYNVLKTATSVNQASDYVLEHFENPDNWQAQITTRRGYCQRLYDEYAGSEPGPGPGPGGGGLGAWFAIFKLQKQRRSSGLIVPKPGPHKWYF